MAENFNIIGDVGAPYAYIGQSRRKIGTLIPHIVIREMHQDDTAITDHPVETGSAITDHSFLMPPLLQMQVGYSNSTAQSEGYVQQVYEEFLRLQATRQPFDVSTGKRQYRDMMIRSLHVITDGDSEFALQLNIALRKVQFVSTAYTGAGNMNGAAPSPNAGDHTSPQTTAPTQKTVTSVSEFSRLDFVETPTSVAEFSRLDFTVAGGSASEFARLDFVSPSGVAVAQNTGTTVGATNSLGTKW